MFIENKKLFSKKTKKNFYWENNIIFAGNFLLKNSSLYTI